jgi:hypothetical protein
MTQGGEVTWQLDNQRVFHITVNKAPESG